MSASRLHGAPRVLLFSQRNMSETEVWRATLREFEEITREVDAVELLAPVPGRWFPHRRRLALRVGRDAPIVLNPGVPRVRLDRDYDLFFAICEKTSELLNVNAVENWRDRCRTSICLLSELWVKEIPLFTSCLNVLAKFDYVFSYLSQSVEAIDRLIPGRCVYMPPGVDALRLSPYPEAPARTIDVFSLGRRSPHVHRALLDMARDNKIFYVYDTISGLHTQSLEDHRFMMASLARRSRYFVVQPAKWDSPHERGDQSEMGTRYFEGAAAGTIMIGEPPTSEPFTRTFFWPDAVVKLPVDPRSIEEVIADMDQQPDRQEKVRRTNVAQSLRRHDWAYRWERVLATAGLEPMPALVQRKRRLGDLADAVEQHTSDRPL